MLQISENDNARYRELKEKTHLTDQEMAELEELLEKLLNREDKL